MKYVATTVASVCITTVLLFALSQNIDGIAMSAGLAILGGLGGFVGRDIIKKK